MVGASKGQISRLHHRVHVDNRSEVQLLEEHESLPCTATEVRCDQRAVCLTHADDLAGGDRGFMCDFSDSSQEESQPCLPFSFITNCLQHVVVPLTVLFEEVREIEEWTSQDPVFHQQQSYQQTA